MTPLLERSFGPRGIADNAPPISTGQRHRLQRAGRLRGDIAHVPYDRVRGLDLCFRDDEA